jgi:hypothetical protein
MGFKQWAGAGLLIKLFESIRKGGKVDESADALDERLDSSFGKHSEKIQFEFCDEVLLPMAKRLLREKPSDFRRLLEKHLK